MYTVYFFVYTFIQEEFQMKKKLLLAFMIIAIGIIAFITISVSAATEGIYTYSVSNSEATITNCDTSASGDL